MENPNDRKTAAELGLRPEYLAALEQVLDGLRSGRLVHMVGDDPPPGATELFNMANWQDIVWDDSDPDGRSRECGTVACIGGWAQKFSKIGPHRGYAEGAAPAQVNQLNWLFYPDDGPSDEGNFNFDYAKITPAQAIEALESYLTTGSPRWDAILGQEHD